MKRPNPTTWVFRNWYPLCPTSPPAIRRWPCSSPPCAAGRADQALAALDYRIWNANPTRLAGAHPDPGADRIPSDRLYSVPAGRAAGRIPDLDAAALRGLPILRFFNRAGLPGLLCRLPAGSRARAPVSCWPPCSTRRCAVYGCSEACRRVSTAWNPSHYDCFPSGHTELTILACWGSRLVSKRLFRIYLFYTPALIFATVYLRYHYSVDVLAGAVLASVLILGSPASLPEAYHIGAKRLGGIEVVPADNQEAAEGVRGAPL